MQKMVYNFLNGKFVPNLCHRKLFHYLKQTKYLKCIVFIFLNSPADGNETETTLSTEYTIPLDYDTEDLRNDLTRYGEPPGPITKTTKRLYLKKLIKFQRNPAKVPHINGTTTNQSK